MMRVPVPGDRWLRVLGIALLLLAALAFLPWIQGELSRTGPSPSPIPHYASAAVIALVGVVALISGPSQQRESIVPFVAAAAIGTAQLLYVSGLYLGFAIAPLVAGAPAAFLIGSGAPFLWGIIIVERDHPEDKRARREAIFAAKVILVGFVITFLLEVLGYVFRPAALGGLLSNPSPIIVLYSIFRLCGRILLFWSVVEVLRKAKDVDTVRLRAIRVHQLLCGWFTFTAAGSVVTLVRLILAGTEPSNSRVGLWHGLVILTLTLAAACLAAQRYRPQDEVRSP